MGNMFGKESTGKVPAKKKVKKTGGLTPKFGFGKKSELGMHGKPMQYGAYKGA